MGKKLDTVITSVDMFIGKYWNVLSFFSSSSFVSFGLCCAVCPSGGINLVSVRCYINIAGRKPVSSS
jgi:hypothetical protein